MLKFDTKTLTLAILFLIILLGFGLRVYKLSQSSYWLDEAISINAVSAIYKNGYPLLDSGLVYKSGILNSYFIAISGLLFGQNEFGYRASSVIFGTLIILLIYILSQKLFKSNTIALACSFLTAFSTWEILWSRQARGYIQLQFFYLLSLYLLYKVLNNFSFKNFGFLMLACLGAYFSHPTGIFVFAAVVLAMAIKYFKKINLANFKKNYILSFLVVALTAILLWFVSEYLAGSLEKTYFLADDYLFFLLSNYFFIFFTALISLFFLISKKQTRLIGLLFLAGAYVPMFSIMFTTDFLQFRYMFVFFPALILLSSYALFLGTSFIKSRPIRIGLILLFLILPNIKILTLYPPAEYSLETRTPQPDFKSAYNVINLNRQADDIIISPYSSLDKIYFGQSDYWLKISLTGKASELKFYNSLSGDYYNNTPAVDNFGELKAITEKSSGFVVIDEMALNRLGDNYYDQLLKNYELLYYKDDGDLKKIWVYRF